jgi:hypothetical protein
VEISLYEKGGDMLDSKWMRGAIILMTLLLFFPSVSLWAILVCHTALEQSASSPKVLIPVWGGLLGILWVLRNLAYLINVSKSLRLSPLYFLTLFCGIFTTLYVNRVHFSHTVDLLVTSLAPILMSCVLFALVIHKRSRSRV